MKKVLVLAAAVALFATPALAGITGTKHDLTPTGGSGSYNGTITEICVYCHTPHGADTTVTKAPLWNRSTVDATALYGGLDLNAASSSSSGYGLSKINQSDAPLCLSCHDGASLGDTLNNPPNTGGNLPDTEITGVAALTTDLSDDHPVGFNYDSVDVNADSDGEIIAMATAVAGGVKFYGAGSNEMWCSSCHDVHNNSESPFLNVTVAASTLCKTCHAK